MSTQPLFHKGLGLFLSLMLAACTSTGPQPAALAPDPQLLGVRTAWSQKIGPVDFALNVPVALDQITLADSAGEISALDARTGALLWRASVGAPLSAGVGSDGKTSAVVTRNNELLALQGTRVVWRARLPTQVFTAPLVAGERVFVHGADRSVAAFDAASGQRLWLNQRPGEALMLRQPGVLLAVGNTLVSGSGARLQGLNPLNGNLQWDVALASPRGANDIERLADLVAGVARSQEVICARAFQSAVGCVDARRGNLLWKRPAQGASGVSGDAQRVYGVESDGSLLAWSRDRGQELWRSDVLRLRQPGAPLALGRSLVVGDASGWLHFFASADGSVLTRFNTQGGGLAAAPLVVDTTLVAVTRTGTVLGLRPE